MNRSKLIGLSLMCGLLFPAFPLDSSAAGGGCTVQQRIELGKQGYDRDQVEQACVDDGESFWVALGRGLATELANGLTKELNRALGGRENASVDATPATADAHICVTNAGTCPLSGGPTGYLCYCRTWNGLTFTGLSK